MIKQNHILSSSSSDRLLKVLHIDQDRVNVEIFHGDEIEYAIYSIQELKELLEKNEFYISGMCRQAGVSNA